MATIALTAVAVVACSVDPPPPVGVPDEHLPLYEMIHTYREDEEAALERIVSGDLAAGRALLASATDRLAVAAEVCAGTPGCEAGLFTRAGASVLETRAAVEIVPAGTTVAEAVPEIARTVTLLDGRDLRELIPINPRVQAALNDWLTWNRPTLMNAYDNYQFLRDRIAPIYDDAGLPEALLFGMMAKETGVRAHSYSRAGAAGP
ncbi:MAG: lytic transglycosylase, partial [Acidobacteriota bacterium]|nr:lytic transglycosylase [Acidobacteriota bacterium]